MYIKKYKLLFYLQLFLFSTIPLLSVKFLRINLSSFSIPIFFIFVITGIGLYFFANNYSKELRVDRNTVVFIALLLLFLIYQFINSFKNITTFSFINSIDEVVKTFSSLIVFIFIFYFLKNTIYKEPKQLFKLFNILIIISTIILIILIIRYYFHFNSKYLGIILEYRTEAGKNQLALYLGIIFPIVLNTYRERKNLFNLIYLFVHILAIIYVDSRGVLISLFLSYYFVFVFFSKRYFIQIITILSIFLFFIYVTIYFKNNYSFIIEKINTYNAITDIHLYRSDQMREILAAKSIYFFASAPFFGIGTNQFLSQVGYLTHNSFLQILCEQGIFGLTIFLLILLVVLLTVKNLFKKSNKYEKSLLISSLVPIFYFNFINAYNLILIYIFWSLLFILNNYKLSYDNKL